MTIKFRGKEFKTGNIVFGKYLTSTHNHEEGEEKVIWIGDEENGYHIVEDDSIAQLVGYDSDGKEIYEGDELIDSAGHEWTAILLPQAEMDCGGVYEGLYGKEKFKLKGCGENENLS